ncbi:MAG: DNA topoisomerase VI subunit B [Ignisphaera sp.]|nr:DNA topoisomerase VI subunit B [Ignisphaera sp.]MCX8168000.1 DNA topoisomerase VI subunit B [Ignisphaera sp.]MDW8085529.1 DNA topoisomerase VI subunit B [Ignisphaera sp.]
MSTLEKFRAISPAEFFYRNKEIAGFSNPARALYQSVRELLENALDATDAHGILPNIEVSIDRDTSKPVVYRITVKDNGIGIPEKYIPEAFGRVLFSSKYVLRQTRGLFGLGAKMIVLYGQITVGEPAEIVSATMGSRKVYSYRISIDVKENKPIILQRGVWPNTTGWHGTIVKIAVEGDWGRAKQKILDYVRRTAIVTPYANLVLRTPDEEIYTYPRVTDKLPPPPRETHPHPHGIDIEMLKIMAGETEEQTLLDFISNEFQGVGRVIAERFLRDYGFKLDKNPKELSKEELEAMAKALKEFGEFRKPRAEHLSPIGADLVKIGLNSILKPEFVDAITLKPVVYEGHAVIVEVGLAYGGAIEPSDEPQLLRFANKIPLLYDEKSDVSWKVVSENIDWSYYEIAFPAPIAILTHICGTKIPYKGVGKESVAEVPVIEHALEEGVRHVARSLKLYLTRKQREEEYMRKAITIIKYIPEVSSALTSFLSSNPEPVDPKAIEDGLFELVKKRYGEHIKELPHPRSIVLSVE